MIGEYPGRPNHSDLTDLLWTLTKRCWGKEAQDRPGVQEVVKVLEDLSAIILCLLSEHSIHTSSQRYQPGS